MQYVFAPGTPFECIVHDSETQVYAWRMEQLDQAGFDLVLASAIVGADADWHLAVQMAEQGCPHRKIVEILT